MNLNKIIQSLNLTILTNTKDFSSINVKSGYCSDLLSCVMTGAEPEGLWITLMSHSNIVAVAALLDLSAIVITENAQPDHETVDKANEKGVTMLSSPEPNFAVIGQLWELGLRAPNN
ncbi:MAG: serine kinase [Chloroflexota bacterium]|nr:serine kinase [Chloroflexota bacterium]